MNTSNHANLYPCCLRFYFQSQRVESGLNQTAKIKRLLITLGLLSSFLIVEIGAGLWSHSLALLADAAHVFFDLGAVGLALLASWWVKRSNGTGQTEALAACINSLGLVMIAIGIAYEAIGRLQSPIPDVLGLPMLVTASSGLLINGTNALLLYRSSHHDLNIKAVFLHVVADAVSALGTLLAAIAISIGGWVWADSVASLLIAILAILSAFPLFVRSFGSLRHPQPRLTIQCQQERRDLEQLLYPSLEEQVR